MMGKQHEILGEAIVAAPCLSGSFVLGMVFISRQGSAQQNENMGKKGGCKKNCAEVGHFLETGVVPPN